MRFPELATRLVALRERFDVDYAALAQRLVIDKTTAWRWFQGAANLTEQKQQKLIVALCQLLAENGISLTEDDFRLNNTYAFFSKIGISKLRAALLSGVTLPIPESLIDAALDSQERLYPFLGNYQAFWSLPTGEFARAQVVIEKQPDGRVAFALTWNGYNAFNANASLCMIGNEPTVVGDRIAGDYTATRSLFTMALHVDFDSRTKTVQGLYGFMPDRANGEPVLRRMTMVPAKVEEVDDYDTPVDANYVRARASARAMTFLTAA